MKNKSDKEINEFLKLFSPKRAEPDLKFKVKLRKQIIKEYSRKNSFFNFRLSFLVIFAITILIGIFLISNLPYMGRDNQKTISLTNTRKREVLDNVVKNNHQILLTQMEQNIAQESSTQTIVLGAVSSNLETTHSTGFINDTIISKPGSKYNQCFSFSNTTERIDYFAFSNDKNVFFVKTVSFDSNGNLKNYILTKKEEDRVEAIIYQGGSKAAKIITPLPTNQPITYLSSFPISYATEESPDFFPENTEVIEKNIDNKDYYIIEIKEEMDCLNGKLNTILNFIINKETFEVEKIESYLTEVSSENLIYTTERFSNTEVVPAESEIYKIFEFEYPAVVEEIKIEELDLFLKTGEVKGMKSEILSYPENLE